MVENRPWLTVLAHFVLIVGVAVIAFPVWITFVASTHDSATLLRPPVPLLPGPHLIDNYSKVLSEGFAQASRTPLWRVLANSLIMALGVSLGKIAISLIAAYAIVYFRFPLRMTAFWMIFITLMLPIEVRIVPTYDVVANAGRPLQWLVDTLDIAGLASWVAGRKIEISVAFNMLNSYGGLIIPLIASATATFLFRQFFLSVPDELTEAARVDGAGPTRFFFDILLPMSRTSIAALFVIQFIYGWNQYLWPLLITTEESFYTVIMTLARQANVVDGVPQWNLIMTVGMLAMLPPVLVVVLMQRQFVRGLVETEK
jgi:sn-glycerol 3-phosphate transport system permease protein